MGRTKGKRTRSIPSGKGFVFRGDMATTVTLIISTSFKVPHRSIDLGFVSLFLCNRSRSPGRLERTRGQF